MLNRKSHPTKNNEKILRPMSFAFRPTLRAKGYSSSVDTMLSIFERICEKASVTFFSGEMMLYSPQKS